MKQIVLCLSLLLLASQVKAIDAVQKVRLYTSNSINRKIEFMGDKAVFPVRLTHKTISGDIPWRNGIQSHKISINGITYEWVWAGIGSGVSLQKSALYTTDRSRSLWKICDRFEDSYRCTYKWDAKQSVILVLFK